MTVNVITLRYVTDGKRHLVCEPYTTENLHRMAQELGLKRAWYHVDHYDIPVRRIAEIEAKCQIVSTRQLLEIIGQSRKLRYAGKSRGDHSNTLRLDI